MEDHHWKDFCSSFGDHCSGSGEPIYAEGLENSVSALGRQLWQQVEEGKEEKVKGESGNYKVSLYFQIIT